MIESDPRRWMKNCLDKWSGNNKFGRAERIYLKAFKQKKRIHATCEDYRASASIDLEHDKKDRKKLLNIPIQVLWGKEGVVGKQFNSLKIWKKYTKNKVYGSGIKSGHFIPEQNPKNQNLVEKERIEQLYKHININKDKISFQDHQFKHLKI